MALRLFGGVAGIARCGTPAAHGVQPLLCCVRLVASYPTPGTIRSQSKATRKKFNFLSSERLVQTNKGRCSRRAIRMRDDVFHKRRVQFREHIKADVEKNIRYFPDSVKHYVFFKGKENKLISSGFHCVRKVPGLVLRRILYMVEEEITKLENRDHLIEMIESAGGSPPTQEEWDRYTDEAGKININLYFHPIVDKFLRGFCLGRKVAERFRALQAFMFLKRNDFDVCPPLRSWSLRQGPIRDEELLERSEMKDTRDIITEMAMYQRPHVVRAFGKQTAEQKEKFVEEAESNREELRAVYERERLFAAKVMLGVTALKEMRALTNPAITYYNHEYYKSIIRMDGSVEATPRRTRAEVRKWYLLPKEEQLKFYCFERALETRPVSGANLYVRYACRDYGLSREEAVERWASLSELQKAALHFCFFAPISAPRRSVSAFRRFYNKQCYQHGLVMTGKSCGNRAFFLRMRKMWNEMNADERAQFEDTDAFSSVFPLHPPSSASGKGAGAPEAEKLEGDTSNSSVGEGLLSLSSQTPRDALKNRRSPSTPSRKDKDDDDDNDDDDDDDDDGMLYFKDEVISEEGTNGDGCEDASAPVHAGRHYRGDNTESAPRPPYDTIVTFTV
ncbi:hypothetical protein TRVL_03604 [Trypanosoma vivax]|nr:hypothetical protein TRVL_03604 [Trypanosoma vivax]